MGFANATERNLAVMSPRSCEKEWEELHVRLQKLSMFINANPEFQKLPIREQCRLHLQLCHMRNYSEVLRNRIDSHFM